MPEPDIRSSSGFFVKIPPTRAHVMESITLRHHRGGAMQNEQVATAERPAVVKPPALPSPRRARSDTLATFREHRASRDLALYERLVCRYLPLVHKIARRYASPTAPYEDLVQIGTIGLMAAVKAFNPDRGVRFEAYAYYHIAGEIRHYLRDDLEAVHVPRGVRKRYRQVAVAASELQQRLGRTPTSSEIAGHLGLTEGRVLEMLQTHNRFRIRSLSDAEENADVRRALAQTRRYVSFQLAVEDRVVLMQAIQRLAELQRKVVYYLFYQDLPQSEAAKRLGISQRYVSRLLAMALTRLSALLRAPYADSA